LKPETFNLHEVDLSTEGWQAWNLKQINKHLKPALRDRQINI